jgi:methylenetetrahydrofolate reductase (NADPH)
VADFELTQLFFDNADYFEFRDYLVDRLGVTVPICPGVIPIQGVAQIKRFTTMCGARIPAGLLEQLDRLAGDEEGVREFGIEYATRQCQELLAGGAPGIHFYTLNKARSTAAVLRGLAGRRPAVT